MRDDDDDGDDDGGDDVGDGEGDEDMAAVAATEKTAVRLQRWRWRWRRRPGGMEEGKTRGSRSRCRSILRLHEIVIARQLRVTEVAGPRFHCRRHGPSLGEEGSMSSVMVTMRAMREICWSFTVLVSRSEAYNGIQPT